MKTTSTTTETTSTETTSMAVFGFKKEYEKTTKTTITILETEYVQVAPKVAEKREVIKSVANQAAADEEINSKLIPESAKTKSCYQRVLQFTRGHLHWLNAMSYGVSGGVLTNILTGTGNVDLNVALLAITTTVITITGLIKVYFDVQFKGSG